MRVEAAALNRLDLFVRDGIPGVPVAFPHVPGADGTGVVEALGAGVKGPAPGTRVVLQPGLSCGTCEFCLAGERSLCVSFRILGEHVPGTFAEKIAVPRANVFPAPTQPVAREGCGVPARGAHGVAHARDARGAPAGRDRAHPRRRRRRLDVCGPDREALRRLARDRDVVVGRQARAKELGADEAIDYTTTDVGKAVREMTGKRGVDVVVDSVGAATWRHSLTAAAKKGRIVTCGATSGPAPAENINVIFWKQLSILGSTMGTDAEFAAMLAAVEAGRLEPVVDTVFPLGDVRKAYERMASGEGFGKIVLKLSA